MKIYIFLLFTCNLSIVYGNITVTPTSFIVKTDDCSTSIPFKYTLTNSSNKQIRLISIKASCGCVIFNTKTQVLEPHTKCELTGNLHLSGDTTIQPRQITIKTDNIGQPEIQLKLYIEVSPIVDIEKKVLIWVYPNISEKTTILKIKHGFYLKDILFNNEVLSVKAEQNKKGNIIIKNFSCVCSRYSTLGVLWS